MSTGRQDVLPGKKPGPMTALRNKRFRRSKEALVCQRPKEGGAPKPSLRPGLHVPLFLSLALPGAMVLRLFQHGLACSTFVWMRRLPEKVLNSRTPIAAFLRSTLHVDRVDASAPEASLFPLPVPKIGLFVKKRCGSRQRGRCVFDKGFHTLVMALTCRHADCHFVPARALSVLPTQKQLNTLCYLRQLRFW